MIIRRPSGILTSFSWEVSLRVIVVCSLRVEEASQSGDLGGEEHEDDLHLDVEVQSEDFHAGFERLFARGDEHVAIEAELLEVVDELAELGAPA